MSLRASIIIGVELARIDVGERESRREEKASDSRDAGKNRRNALSRLLLHSGYSTSHLLSDHCLQLGDLEVVAAGERAYSLALLLQGMPSSGTCH
jgi:hypothetical protein